MSFIYLAGPYSHPNPAIRALRYDALNSYAARLMQAGIPTFSPISHSHHLAEYMEVENAHSHDFWMRMDLPILRKASGLLVLDIEGMDESRGVAAEISEAELLGIPVGAVNPVYKDLPLSWCRERLA